MSSVKNTKALAKALAGKKAKTKAKVKSVGPTVNKKSIKESDAPAAKGFNYETYYKEERFQVKHNGKLKDAIRIRGCDYLGAVKVPAAEAPGSVYNEIYMSPADFPGTRIELMARLYEKFLFEVFDFKYLPAVGSDVPGQLVIAHDRDISDATPSADENGVREYLAMEDAKAGSVWKPITARCPLRSEEDGFFCNPVVGGDDRLAYQGQTYVACVAPSGKAQGSTLGIILIEYVVIFFIPQLQGGIPVNSVVSPNSPIQTVDGNTGFFDVLKWLASNPALVGLAQYIPKLQADGTYAITVPEGLYDWAMSVYSATTNVIPTATPTVSLLDPQIEALEPQPIPAPQPGVEPVLVINTTVPGAGSVMGNPITYRAYLNVPRGGARIRHKANVVGAAGSTVSFNGATVSATFTRLGAVVQSLLGLFPAPTPVQMTEFGKSKLTWYTLRDLTRKSETCPNSGKKCSEESCGAVPAIASRTLPPVRPRDALSLLSSIAREMGLALVADSEVGARLVDSGDVKPSNVGELRTMERGCGA